MSIHEVKHPLVRHKLGLMRREGISTKNFRELTSEVGRLLTYEATMTWAALTAILLAFVGKLGALLQTIPVPVMGGDYDLALQCHRGGGSQHLGSQ